MYKFCKEMLNARTKVKALETVKGETLHIYDVVFSSKNTFMAFSEYEDTYYILPQSSAKYLKLFKLTNLCHFLYNRVVTVNKDGDLNFRIDELFNLYDIVKKCNDNIKEL